MWSDHSGDTIRIAGISSAPGEGYSDPYGRRWSPPPPSPPMHEGRYIGFRNQRTVTFQQRDDLMWSSRRFTPPHEEPNYSPPRTPNYEPSLRRTPSPPPGYTQNEPNYSPPRGDESPPVYHSPVPPTRLNKYKLRQRSPTPPRRSRQTRYVPVLHRKPRERSSPVSRLSPRPSVNTAPEFSQNERLLEELTRNVNSRRPEPHRKSTTRNAGRRDHRYSALMSLGVSRASRTMKKTTPRSKAATNTILNTITRDMSVGDIETALHKELDLFTFHARYLPFRRQQRRGRNWSPYGAADKNIKEYWERYPHPPVKKDPSEREYVKPCPEVQMNHLRHFNKPNHRMPTKYLDAWKKAVTLVKELLVLPEPLRFPSAAGLEYVRFLPRKFAGVEYARRGLRTRATAHEAALQDAHESWACLMSGTRVKPHDVRLGGKGKMRDKAPPGLPSSENAVGRLILMLSHRDLLVLGNVEQMLTEAYLKPEYPIAAGFRWCHGDPTKFAKKLEPYDRYYCLDAFKFDANISEWLVDAAIRILREQFVNGNDAEYDTYWNFVLESMIAVIIQRDDGIRMQKHQGSTSGHNFNSLVQSVITLLIGYTTFFFKAPFASLEDAKQTAYLISLGDELLMALKYPHADWRVDDIAEVALEGCGVDWSGEKSFSTTRVVDTTPGEFQGILFLGKCLRVDKFWVKGEMRRVITPYRPFQETVECLYYPESFPLRGQKGVLKTYERTLSAYIDAAGNPETRKWLEGLLGWLEQKGAAPPEEWTGDQQLDVQSELGNEGFSVPNPDRWDLQRWMAFTHLPRTSPRDETREERRKRNAETRREARFRWARLGLRGGQQANRYLYA